MEGTKRYLKALAVGTAMVLAATPAFARSVRMEEAGIALWIFLAIGLIIVLLQLIPAVILFFSFVGTTTTALLKGEKKSEEIVISDVEPEPVHK